MDKKILQAFAPLPDTYEDVVTISHEHKERINAAFVKYVEQLEAQANALTAANACIRELAEALEAIKTHCQVREDLSMSPNLTIPEQIRLLLEHHAGQIEKARG